MGREFKNMKVLFIGAPRGSRPLVFAEPSAVVVFGPSGGHSLTSIVHLATGPLVRPNLDCSLPLLGACRG
jgi:hypothetical protein